MKKKLLCLLALMLTPVIGMSTTQPKFSIVPLSLNANVIDISSAASTTVTYQVTNNTSVSRALTMVPLLGISLNTQTAGACSNPFVLSSGASCLLNLVINGSQLPLNGIKSGPEVCKSDNPGNVPSPFLCSQPSQDQQLTLETVRPLLYTTNLGSDN
ncbi:MAG: hypothetical protein ACOYKA_06400, partial [Legionellaceae bacterium]